MRYGLKNIVAILFVLVLCSGCGDGWGFGFKEKDRPKANTVVCGGTDVGTSRVKICFVEESFVYLSNSGGVDVSLDQWTLQNKAGQIFTFGAQVVPTMSGAKISVSPLVIQPNNESLVLKNAAGDVQSEFTN